jgi:hypothetical protein
MTERLTGLSDKTFIRGHGYLVSVHTIKNITAIVPETCLATRLSGCLNTLYLILFRMQLN